MPPRLTGVEAISNGVPAFRRPQARNASQTLLLMGVISITLFLGISWLTTHIHGLTVTPDRSVLAQIGSAVFGEGSVPFYVVQGFTAAILILAANTAYQDFPRLASILANDRYMPSQFKNRGDRLVFSNGVIGLGLASILVIVAFDADLNKVIQMYVVGVFTSFTLSQTGMVRHWFAERLKGPEASKGWRLSIVINLVGAVTTGGGVARRDGHQVRGWRVALDPGDGGDRPRSPGDPSSLHVGGAAAASRHRPTRRRRAAPRGPGDPGVRRGGCRGIGLRAVVPLARSASGVSDRVGHDLSRHAARHGGRSRATLRTWTPIPGRDLLHAVRDYVRAIPRGDEDLVSVVVPEVVTGRFFAYLLRSRELIRLKGRMLREPNVVVTDVPVLVDRG